MSDPARNLSPSELEAIKARVREGLYSSLERDLIVSQILKVFKLKEEEQQGGIEVSDPFIELFAIAVGIGVNIAVGVLVGQLWRSQPVGGGALGVICGPLGWILVGLLPDQRAKCLDCRRAIHPLATKCGHCGGGNLTNAKVVDIKPAESATPTCCGAEMSGEFIGGQPMCVWKILHRQPAIASSERRVFYALTKKAEKPSGLHLAARTR